MPSTFSAALAAVDHLDPVTERHLDALGDEVDGDDPRTSMLGDAGAHLPYRAQPEDGHAAAVGDGGPLDGLPRRGQHVGEVEEALVGRALGHLDGAEVGLGHPQELGLPPWHLTVELGEAEQRSPHALLAYLGGLALGEELLAAHPTAPTGDVERDDHPVPGPYVADPGAHSLDDAHGFVPEDVTLVEEGAERLVEVEVGAADGRRGDAHDGVGGLFDGGIRYGVHAHIPLAVPCNSSHRHSLLGSEVERQFRADG